MSYMGTEFGELRIPLHVYEEGAFNFDEVGCEYDPAGLALPEDVARYRDSLVEKRREEAEKRGAPFFDDKLARLKFYRISIEDGETEKKRLVLRFGPTTWFTYATTNRSLDDKALLDAQGRQASIREKYIANPLDLDDSMGNATGANTTIITKDGMLYFVERSMKLSQYPGLYGDGAAGFMKLKDANDGVPNPFVTIARELGEEAGIEKVDYSRLSLLGIGRAMDDLHPEIWFEFRPDMTANEIRSRPKSSKYEALLEIAVPFEPKPVLEYLNIRRTEQPETPKWVPAHAVNTIHSLVKEYGFDEVMKAFEELRR